MSVSPKAWEPSPSTGCRRRLDSGPAEERGHLAAASAEADMHEGETGHRTRVVESLPEEASGRPAPRPARPAEMPVLKTPEART